MGLGAIATGVGAVASLAGSVGGGGGGGGGGGAMEALDTGFIEEAEEEAIEFLGEALANAIPYSEAWTEGGIESIKSFYALAREDVMRQQRRARLDLAEGRDMGRNDLMNAQAIAESYFKEYYKKGMALGAPFRDAGYRALDTLSDIAGQPRPLSGYKHVADSETARAEAQGARERLRASGQSMLSGLDIQDYDTKRNMQYAVDAGLDPRGILAGIRDTAPGLVKQKEYIDKEKGLLAPLGATDFENPELTFDGEEIPTRVGDVTNKLNDFVNQIRTGAQNIPPAGPFNQNYSNYARSAAPAYQNLLQQSALMQRQNQESLAGLGGLGGAIPYNVYTR